MNILYIITQADGGGAQKYTLSLAKAFGGSIAAGSEATALFDEAKNLHLKTYKLKYLKRSINPFYDFLAMWEIRELIKNLNPDIVHLNSSKAGILGSFAAFGLKKKVVFTAHGFVFNEPLSYSTKAFYLAAEKTASSYRSFIIAVSDADKQSALENNLINPEKIQTIHNGIEPVVFLPKDEARSILKLPDDKIVLGTIANLYKTKGLDVLIKAVTLLGDEIKNKIVLAIIGGGPELENLKLEIKNSNLEQIVLLLGKKEGANKLLKAFNVFILPSLKEGWPYTILEAMQAGLPIIASQVGGIPEALGDSGFLIKPNNAQDLANELKKIISELQNSTSQDLSDKGKKAQARSAQFTETKMLENTEKVYRKLLLE